jgi:asparagine synthase (glutamine-hydrolysing)
MCGICGIAALGEDAAFDERTIDRMRAALDHRGPDDSGTYVAEFQGGQGAGRVGLGHARLSIIDLATGHQPLSNEDGTVWIVFNGEIYNFQELRPELEARGHRFRTHSDTEAIVHLYEEKGPDCVRDLRGMFAFAIWDGPRRRLFMARDRLGQKPLAYRLEPRRIVFGSEMKAVLRAPGVPRELDVEALHDYLTYQYVPHPKTMFRGIRKLPPAHYLLWEEGQARVEEYWRPPFGPGARRSEGEYVDRLRVLMTESVRLRMIADVPLGAFLSGGMDSSIVVGLMAGLSSSPVKTFSIGFEEKRYDELEYARIVARRFGTEHRELVVRPNAVEIIPKLVRHYDEPFADSSAIPTFYVSEMTRAHVKVALTGDAGDEGFAGYPRYRAIKLAQLFDRLPGPLRRGLAGRMWRYFPASVEAKTFRRRLRRLFEALNLPPRERYVRWCAIFDDERKEALYSPELRARLAGIRSARVFDEEYEKVAEMDFLGATTFVDFMRYLPDDLLVKVDIASMAYGLECRAPFLDHKLVEFIGEVPTGLKLRGMTPKYLLRRAFGDLLPKEIMGRAKMGFGVPIAEWFRGDLKDYVRDALLDSTALGRGYFDPAYVRRLVDEHVSARWDHGYRLWSLLMFELWCREYLDSAGTTTATV